MANVAEQIIWLQHKFGSQVEIRVRKKWLGLLPYWGKDGWLWMVDCGTHWNILIGSNEDSNIQRKVIGADFLKGTGARKIGPLYAQGAWQQVIRLWMETDEKQAIAIFDSVAARITSTYDYHQVEYEAEVIAA